MAQSCPNEPSVPPVLAQHLFLGASVNNFYTNMAWGGSSSSLTVELINDFGSEGCNIADPGQAMKDVIVIKEGFYDSPDHFYNCTGDACYMDENGYSYDPFRDPKGDPKPSREKRIPGKVYHELDRATGQLKSKYWRKHDPGFFGAGTMLDTNGIFMPRFQAGNKIIPYRYNIIGVPVIFRYGYFTFGGIVSAWDATINGIQPGGSASDYTRLSSTYRVSISSAETILDNCSVILDEYAGSVFNRFGTLYGGPTNYTGTAGVYTGRLKEGSIPNVFNVYGFLESLGFGSSLKNDDGIPLSYALDTLCLLTSSVNSLNEKAAFSPFERIISPIPLTDAIDPSDQFYGRPTPADFGVNSFGVLPIDTDIYGVKRIKFALDLSEIPRPPTDIRVNGVNGVISITDLIREACRLTNRDWYTVIISKDGTNFIKVKTINRGVAAPANTIDTTVKALTNSGISVTQSSFGQNENSAVPRIMLIGANQKRLFQAKSFLLGYSNTHLVYNPSVSTQKFVDYYRFGKGSLQKVKKEITNEDGSVKKQEVSLKIAAANKFVDSFKIPAAYSTRNITLCELVNGQIVTDIWANEQKIGALDPDTPDPGFSDIPVGGTITPRLGNYLQAAIYKMPVVSDVEKEQRWIPLYAYAISPFFGFVNDVNIPDSDVGNTTNRFVRPVYFDTATGQIAVAFRSQELPVLSIGRLPPLFEARPEWKARFNANPVPSAQVAQAPENGVVGPDGQDPARKDDVAVAPTGNAPTKKPPPTPTPKAPDPFATTKEISWMITESEFRAAMAGLDEYLAYCMAKLDFTKPDLFVMLIKAYKGAGKPLWNKPAVVGTPDPNNTNVIGGQAAGAGAGAFSGGQNAGNQPGIAGIGGGNIQSAIPDLLVANFNMVLNFEFYSDFKIIHDFVKTLGETYYGRKYAVSLPAISVYRDKKNSGFQIPIGVDMIGVYQGSSKIYYSYELSKEGAWEEIGNYIDDNIIIGSPVSYNFVDSENGLIQPILGYNATYIKDYATEKWCSLNTAQRDAMLKKASAAANKLEEKNTNGYPDCSQIRANYELSSIARYFACDKSICPSLDFGSLSNSEYTLVDVPDFGREDPYGQRMLTASKFDPCGITRTQQAIQTQKLYIKTTTDEIVFYSPINFGNPKAIINSPGVNLAFSSTSYREDPNKTVISNVAAEDLGLLDWLERKGQIQTAYNAIATVADNFNFPTDVNIQPTQAQLQAMTDLGLPLAELGGWQGMCQSLAKKDPKTRLEVLKYCLKKLIVPITDTGFLIPAPNSSNQSASHYAMVPKRANPVFAAIPVEDKIACYGPWTNYPDLADKAIVFPGITFTDDAIEQLISKTHVEKNNEYAPWKYGGMAFLDTAILYQIDSLTSYQTKLESGELTIAGAPIFSIGGNLIFKKTDYDLNMRNIRNLLTYQFYALDFIGSGGASYSALTISDMRLSLSSAGISTTYSFRTYSPKRGIYSKENQDRLQQLAQNRLSSTKRMQNISNGLQREFRKQILDIIKNRQGGGKDVGLESFKSKLYGTSPSTMIIGKAKHYWPIGNYSQIIGKTNEDGTIKENERLRFEKSRYDAWAGFFTTREALNELGTNYDSQAGMSFDGLLSPVSLYPTSQGGTYPISSRFGISGTFCPGCKNTYVIDIGGQQHPCPLCQKTKLFPSSTGLNLDINFDGPPTINFLTLNPIVLPQGDFVNTNSQSSNVGERNRHNISFIARNDAPISDRNIMINNNLTSYTSNDTNPDWSSTDQTVKLDVGPIVANHRFFSFRGPMMLHGWGYDIDGYPVPNAADEPLEFDPEGRTKRFFMNPDGSNDLTKDGDFIPTPQLPLGDTIGKGWSKDGGEWARTPSNKFHLNWAERPDLWPIGPIDLRWDYNRKVWVAGGGCTNADPPYLIASGNNIDVLSQFSNITKSANRSCTYKMVYGILEQDLKKMENSLESFPVRAFLDDLEYALQPLPENIRRLIYIVDRTGYTAPRGAKILLRYNIDTGFYEPVSKQQYIAVGKISGQTTTLELAYMPGYKSGDNTYKATVSYVNPLNLDYTKTNGMFLYDNGNWNLISVG